MTDKAKAAVLAAFAADALALGVHWIYNTRVIDKKLGRVETLLKPEIASFHKGKEKGDFTHYGDQMLVLLESVSARGAFDRDDFSERWQALFRDYNGYVDGATRDTLAHIAAGKRPEDAGSGSTDLGGPARIAPLFSVYGDDAERLVEASIAQTAMTHNTPIALKAAEFFARSGWLVLNGTAPATAMTQAAKASGMDDAFRRLIQDGVASRDLDTRQAIADFGQMCEAEAALPATVHLIVKYEDDLKTALVENVMAGGDSSARGMLAAMVLGAYHGSGAIPAEWLTGLNRYDHIQSLLIR